VLAPVEIAALFATLRTLAASGTAILVITHKLQEVVSHAQRVTVMRAGRVVMRDRVEDTSIDAIARAMVGGDLPAVAARAQSAPVPAFAAREISAEAGAHGLRDATFEVRGGEIVGIAGVEGNGQTALTDAIAGLIPYAGTMTLGGESLDGRDAAARIAAGIRTIPQDRQREALVLDWSIADNVALGDHARAPMRHGLARDGAAARALATQIVERFDVRTPSIRTHVAALSGGNQQKVVVGRALAHDPVLVIAYQPTRGIDVGAAALVQSRLIEARNAGAAVLLISFELDEVLAVSDRILVMFRGAIAGTFEREHFDRARIGALMAGAT
jgi:simple sugar transport system ATP-binding protein